MYSFHEQIPGSWKTKIFANYMGWFEGHAGASHRGGICDSMDPRTIQTQVQLAHDSDLDGFIVDWYGPANERVNIASLELAEECERNGMKFCLMLDGGIVKYQPTGTNLTQLMQAAIAYAQQNFMQSSAYATLGGKQALFEFGWRGSGIDIPTVISGLPYMFISQDNEIAGFNGSFGWVNGFAPDTAYKYIDRMLAEPTMLVPAVMWGFNDSSWRDGQAGKSIWNPSIPARIIDSDFGNVWKYNWYALAQKYSASSIIPPPEMIQVCTWNDYDERTAVEPFLLAMAGRKLFGG